MENWIKKEVIIDFDVPSSAQYLIDLCEKANSEEELPFQISWEMKKSKAFWTMRNASNKVS